MVKPSKKRPRGSAVPHSGLGTNRYVIFRKAAERIKDAYHAGYYLDALALVASILEDRLHSRLAHLTKPKEIPGSFGAMLRELIGREEGDFLAVVKAIDEWRPKRNDRIHGMSKLEDLNGPRWEERLAGLAHSTAEGMELLLQFDALDAAARRNAGPPARPPATWPDALQPLREALDGGAPAPVFAAR